ncbi:AAA family ATPase [Psychrobacter sp. UBA2514]|uniref:AAA family ATPase n=1 Tax=Psychrobacter sp. UBA2514 TaxID=1947346 RepID=UPI00257FA69E|nr:MULTISPECIES: AAA family ATPase [Gammaproteobacteria]|tara:strand:+ start:1567 stop:3213 length:1647 start_codon:yes stop_codon:yes gene_type:complete
MSGQLYNLIMASVPSFYSGDQGEFTILKDRFLEYTEAAIKEQFQSLDQDAINNLKNLPTIFAVEDEVADARIGKITDIKVNSNNLRVKYRFGKDYYPLTRSLLKEKQQKLDIDDFEFHRGHWAVKKCDISEFYGEYLKSLTGIAHELKNTDKKVQLIYAFNGTGKTRLSREFKKIIAPKEDGLDDLDGAEQAPLSRHKVFYYNAFTEDLFYWDNDLDADAEPKLKIQPNTFTDWIIRDRGQDQNIIANFQRYTNNKLTPKFIEETSQMTQNGRRVNISTFPEVEFTYERGSEHTPPIKISKGEESNFVWSVFFTLLEEVMEILKEPDIDKREDDYFNELEYVFIDDPVSSLDDNHLIELAVNLASLIKSSECNIKFVITTHNPLFYNVLSNEFNNKWCKNPEAEPRVWNYKPNQCQKYRLNKNLEERFDLIELGIKTPFSYHLHLLSEIRKAISDNQVKKYHFNFLRNVLEKTATFLGHDKWENLLPKVADHSFDSYANRILQLSSHSAHAGEETGEVEENDKVKLEELVNHISSEYGFWQQEVEVDQ